MRVDLESRLQRLEGKLPQPRQVATAWDLLSSAELLRIFDAADRDRLAADELAHWVSIADERRAAGLTRADAERETATQDGARILENAYLTRWGGYSDGAALARFDALDLTPAELATLARLLATATAVAELAPHAGVIGRCWLDSQPLTVEVFAGLALAGHFPPQPARKRSGRID